MDRADVVAGTVNGGWPRLADVVREVCEEVCEGAEESQSGRWTTGDRKSDALICPS